MSGGVRYVGSKEVALRRSGRGAAGGALKFAAGLVALALLAPAIGCSGGSMVGDDTGIEPLVGQWRGVLLSQGGELPFHFRVNPDGSDPVAVIINAGVEKPIFSVSRQGAASYTLRFHEDAVSELVAKMSPDGKELFGYWRLKNDQGPPAPPVTQMPFSATKNDQRRFQRNDPTLEIASAEAIAALPDVSGEWETRRVSAYSDATLTERLVQDGERVTVASPDEGRHREGIYRNGLLRMSSFDGYRALLLHARATPDGRLEGSFWAADLSEASWSARRREEISQ